MTYERLISQLAHVELVSPAPDETVRYLVDVLGLSETARTPDAVYLRCWGDFFHHSVKIVEGPAPALGHVGWRTEGPDQLAAAVARLESAGAGEGWVDDETGHGPAYRYRGPGGHLQEVFWEVERYRAPTGEASTFPARPQRHAPRGVAPRQLDHVTVATRDPYGDSIWYRDTLAYRFTEYTALDEEHPDVIVFSMVTTNEKSHDL
ncbi:MAG TPA: VOC family protein, partial [Gaiellaceae bacterium]|nr:VOC family protein [Gaiellaceae bacterium]